MRSIADRLSGFASPIGAAKSFLTIADFNNGTAGRFTGQILQPSSSNSAIDIIADPENAANTAARFTANADTGVVGKSHYIYAHERVGLGRWIETAFDIYLPSTSPAGFDGVEVCDFETNDYSTNPGTRLQIAIDGALIGFRLERSKIGQGSPLSPFAAGQLGFDAWHHVRCRVTLGDTASTGRFELWVDGVQEANAAGITVLTQAIWEAIPETGPAPQNVNRLQHGISANTDPANSAVMWMDNIKIRF